MIDTVDKPKRTGKKAETTMTPEEGREMVAEILEEKGITEADIEAMSSAIDEQREVDADALAELAERGRMGLAGIEDHIPDATEMVAEDAPPSADIAHDHEGNPRDVTNAVRTVDVSTYDANGEPSVVTQAIPAPIPAPSASNTPPAGATLQVALPGFPAGTKVGKVIIAFGGGVELDKTTEEHRKLLAALEWKEEVEMVVTVSVRDIALQERADDRFRAALKVTSARLVEPTYTPSDDVLPVENPCGRCRVTPVYGMDMFCEDCLVAMAAEDTGPCVKCGEITDSFVLRRCEHCFAEDGTLLVYGLCGTCKGEGELREFECWEHRENPNEDDAPSVASALTEALADAIAAEAAE